MIEGEVTEDYIPHIVLTIGSREWIAVVDTGFNGDLELPRSLKDVIDAESIGDSRSELAGGQWVVEEWFETMIEFDGRSEAAVVTFVESDEVLIGARLLREHHLEINFPAGTVRLERRTNG